MSPDDLRSVAAHVERPLLTRHRHRLVVLGVERDRHKIVLDAFRDDLGEHGAQQLRVFERGDLRLGLGHGQTQHVERVFLVGTGGIGRAAGSGFCPTLSGGSTAPSLWAVARQRAD